uniref:Uncharacterized protein n=1 Tax=viral metagenome TaxID=1070528 RepID=A0A6M3LEC1_9ZZZZ
MTKEQFKEQFGVEVLADKLFDDGLRILTPEEFESEISDRVWAELDKSSRDAAAYYNGHRVPPVSVFDGLKDVFQTYRRG